MNIMDAEDQREAFRILLEKLEHNGEIILNEHENSAWITKNDFKNYNFAEGDSDIINLL